MKKESVLSIYTYINKRMNANTNLYEPKSSRIDWKILIITLRSTLFEFDREKE